MLELSRLAVGSFQSNCYLLWDREGEAAALIDPGAEPQKIHAWSEGAPVSKILITHGHHDHVGALDEVRRAFNVPVYGHARDAEHFSLEFDNTIASGSQIKLGIAELEVYEVPGHTPGSVAFVLVEEPFARAIVGDAIFPGGPGHTRSHAELNQLLDALAETVFTWPDAVTLHPGHGEATTVGAEREAFEQLRDQELPADLYGDVTWR